MLVSAVIALKPAEIATIHADQGRAMNDIFLGWVQARDAALSAELHQGSEIRPYTVSDLRGASPAGSSRVLHPEKTLWWRITTLQERLSRLLLEHILPALPDHILLGEGQDPHRLDITACHTSPSSHPWANVITYEELTQSRLMAARKPRTARTIEFVTPTVFRSKQRILPFPLPELVVNQWVNKWNNFAPIQFPAGMQAFAAESLAVSRYVLRSHTVRQFGGYLLGFTGRVTYIALEEDAYWQRAFQTLTDFAFYCGTGAKTSFGLGQTRPINLNRAKIIQKDPGAG
ncbi:MAG: CRISPR system precrRNA processing endoribonuclease RAMP protein Cas6 [Anaerolineae bacterium]|nr:CRISPR system precrRNA processing endoribonuclease RAMP protein Cas6 [Anaerolineae bacterium]